MSAYSVSEPFLQFVDRDGQPLEDGYVFIGLGGANPEANPITVYLDAALTTPIAQPIRTTNGYPVNGSTPVALYVNASDYSVTLKDKNGSLVVTRLSNVISVPFDNTTGSISATRVTFQQTGSSVTRTLDSRLKESVSVFDFMTAAQIADVQARTLLLDVTAPIQTAIASGARDVYFPAGSYRVTSSSLGIGGTPVIRPPQGVPMRIHGAGAGDPGTSLASTIIKDFGDGKVVSLLGTFVQLNDTVLCDMAIQATALTKELVYVSNAGKCMVERVWLQTAGFDGLRVEDSTSITIRDVRTTGTNTGGGIILAQNTIGCVVDGCYISDHAKGLWIAAAGGTRPRGHTVIGCTFSGSADVSLYLDNADDCRAYGCTFLPGDPNEHIFVDGSVSPCVNNLVHGCKFETVGGGSLMSSVRIDRANGTTLDSCWIDATGATNSWVVTANATATSIINTVELGTEANASAGTTRYMEGLYAVRRANNYTGQTRFGMGSATGEGVVEFDTLSDAMKWRKVQIAGSAPGQTVDVGVLQLRALDSAAALSNSNRFFTYGGNLYVSAGDPTTLADGWPVGPGCRTFTVATLPVGAQIGTIARVTDQSIAATVWGQTAVAIPGPTQAAFVVWTGARWSIIGVG